MKKRISEIIQGVKTQFLEFKATRNHSRKMNDRRTRQKINKQKPSPLNETHSKSKKTKLRRNIISRILKLLSRIKRLVSKSPKKQIINKRTHSGGRKIELHKKYLERLAKINENLPHLEQRMAHKGSVVKKQLMIQKTRKRVENNTSGRKMSRRIGDE